MTQSYQNIQLALGQKWINQYCKDIPGYIPLPETGAYNTIGENIIGVLTALQKNIGISLANISTEYSNTSHLFGDETKAKFGDYSLSVSSDFSNEYNLNMLKILQIGLWCKGKNPGNFGVATSQLTIAINELMSDAGILQAEQDGVASRMIFIAISTEVDFVIPINSNGNTRTRNIQRMINASYGKERGFLVPCDGIKAVSTIAGFLYYYQRTIGLSPEEADNAYGLYNTQTYDLSPILEEDSTNFLMVTILQDALFLISGYDSPSSGIFDGATEALVSQLQLSVGLPMTGVVDKLTWGYVLESCGYQNVAPTVCDTSMALGPNEIQILKDNNITMVGRYLTERYAMTPEEIYNLINSNISVIPIFEYSNELEYFTFEQGQQDALAAALAAENLGIPANNSVTIYFAVDNDFTLGNLESNITDYFNGIFTKIIEAQLGYNIGIYGARYACTYMLEKGYASNSYVSSSSYEYHLNIGYPMPIKWGFNQYSTMNINAEGEASTIYLNGTIPIDKVVASGYDPGVTKLTNGIKSSSSENSTTNQSIESLNKQNYPIIKKVATEIFSNLFNIKSPNLADYMNKAIGKGIKDRVNKPWVYIPPNNCAYIRGDFGIKFQAGSGSDGTLYFNKDDDSWSPSPTLDLLPSAMGSNIGVNVNPKALNLKDIDKAFKSLMPTISTTLDIDNINIGLQFYSCWNGNIYAKKGYWEIGVEIGYNPEGNKFDDISTSLYYFVDIIIGIKESWADKLLIDELESKTKVTFETIINFISKTINSISEAGAEIVESEGSEATLEFSEGTPELFETIAELGSATSEEIAMSTWEDFITMLEPFEADLVTAAIIAVCC